MMAWMDREALALTLKTGWVTYWSRSRNQLWKKGESSGHLQRLIELRIDCDGDTLLCRVNQEGPACHTGRDNCFYFSLSPDDQMVRVNQSIPVTQKVEDDGANIESAVG
jgi:phosphoribosyl-AMP cyclohydrolase